MFEKPPGAPPSLAEGLQLSEKAAPMAAEVRSSRVWLALRRDRMFWTGSALVCFISCCAIFAPLLAPHNPSVGDLVHGLNSTGNPLGPFTTARYPLGTDSLGRDEMSRLLFGTRTSLTIGVSASALATLIGTLVGAMAGYGGDQTLRVRLGPGGRAVSVRVPLEALLMRATDVVLSLPALLLAIALVVVVGPSLALIAIVIGIVMWTSVARIVYGRVVIVKEYTFIEASQALGGAKLWVFRHHILRQILPLVVVYGTLAVARAILFEATLSYLGIGVPPPAAAWGSMIVDGQGYYTTDPWLILFPGFAIMLTVLAFSMLADSLRDALDVSAGT